ncbi:MAG: PorT family protein [Bacteroidales bacterium]|nr:PorT family protein [Bacteroidales bacterium]
MKKTIIIILFLAFIIFAKEGLAQNKPFLFGFKIAPNIGWMKPDSKGYENNGTKTGFSWGFVSQFYLMENYFVLSGFDVTYINSRLTYPHTVIDIQDSSLIDGTLYRDYKLKYVKIPLELKMMTREFGKARFFGKIGLGTSFLIDADAKDEFKSDKINESSENDIQSEIKVLRESLIIGFGVDYSLGGSTALSVGLTFDNGFIDVLKDQNSTDSSIKNNAFNNFFELNIGIVF